MAIAVLLRSRMRPNCQFRPACRTPLGHKVQINMHESNVTPGHSGRPPQIAGVIVTPNRCDWPTTYGIKAGGVLDVDLRCCPGVHIDNGMEPGAVAAELILEFEGVTTKEY